ncbi:HAMP domain-containing methyl-accepting chemotaxis protein [Lysinibacillus sp. KU-BSD001]|uniref:methyl-accepting chemotaxis protein n=1 Tax=Lysinibacillus sp. KU-BSD001 TaxID=3141328 RepID=UPI0036F191FD
MFKSMKWKMMLPILAAVILIISAFSAFIYNTTNNSIQQQGEALVESIKLGLEGAITSRDVAEKIMEEEMIAESVLISWILENGGQFEDLKALAERGGIDEIWSTDAQGNTTITSIAEKIDFNFASDPNGQAYEYMKLITGEETAITQSAQIRDVDDQFYKFVGVSSWNPASPKIVQVARNGQALLDLEAQIGKEFYIGELNKHLSETVLYAAVVDASGEVLAATNEDSLEKNAFTTSMFSAQELVKENTRYNGLRAMNYVTPLSNGTYLAITVSNSVLSFILIATVIAAVLAITILIAITNLTISRQVKRILSVRNSLLDISNGEGDLTKRIENDSADEIGQLVLASNTMMDNFQSIMHDLHEQSSVMNDAADDIQRHSDATIASSNDILTSSEVIEKDSRTQLVNIEESALAMEDLARGIQGVTESIMEIANIATDTEQSALKGVKVVDNLLSELDRLHNQTDQSVTRTKSLEQLSEQIGEFTNVITGISDQTNLLALNASIEAARAGEAGKGFAVVAEEVRKLAEESKVAAERISHVVTDVQRETVEIVQAIASTSTVLEDGRAIANEAQSAFHHISDGIQVISDQVDRVSSASEEMTASTEEITASIEDVAELAKHNTDRVEQMASDARKQSKDMAEMAKAVNAVYAISNDLDMRTNKFKLK